MNKKYSKTYQLTHDIDWFCKIGNTPMHFASNCGLLPKKVNDKERNKRIQEQVSLMDNVVDSREHIAINKEYVRARLGDNIVEGGYENYVRTFVNMAMKGFVSCDRVLDIEDTYIWIAKPDKEFELGIEGIPSYEAGICQNYEITGECVHVSCLNEDEGE